MDHDHHCGPADPACAMASGETPVETAVGTIVAVFASRLTDELRGAPHRIIGGRPAG